MRRVLCVCMLVFLTSACSTFFGPIPGRFYHGELPPQSDADASVAREFAKNLANLADLRIVAQTELTGNPRMDQRQSVDLRPRSDEGILVTIMIDSPRRILTVMVPGNTKSPIVERIVSAAQALFSRQYNGAQLVPYTPYRGLLGP